MVRATADVNDTIRHELTTAPGGFVVLKRLTYGEKLQRRAMVSKMSVSASKGSKDFEGSMQLMNEAATQFDFKNCIVDHNLEDENGTKLDLSQPKDFRRLDPRVGDEIDNFLNDLNNFEEDDSGN